MGDAQVGTPGKDIELVVEGLELAKAGVVDVGGELGCGERSFVAKSVGYEARHA